MKCFLVTILFAVLTSTNVYSQATISAKLIDKTTRLPLELVTVATTDAYTATNELGEFDIKTTSDFLVFSHVGYHQLRIEIKSLPDVIELSPKAIIANEVIVKPDYAIQHLREVQKKYYQILKNYKNKRPKATLFYRQQTKTGDNFNEFIECFFTGVNGISISDLSLNNGRYANVKANDSVYTFSLTNAFVFSQIPPVSDKPNKKDTQVIVPLSLEFFKYYDVSLIHTLDPNTSDEVKVYKFDPNQWSLNVCPNPIIGGQLYVRTKDNAIVRFIGESNKNAGLKIYSTGVKILSIRQLIDIVYNDKYDFPIVESAKVEILMRQQGVVSGKTIDIDASIKTIMFTTSVQTQKSRTKIKNSDELIKKVATTKYDPTFWKNNPIIKRTPVENQIIEDFTRLGYFGNFEL